MRRKAATLAVVVALLFSSGSAMADDKSEATQFSLSVENKEPLEKKAAALEAHLAKLNKTFD